MSNSVLFLTLPLLFAVAAVVVIVQNQRYRRIRRRLERSERRTDELLRQLRPLYSHRVAAQLAVAGITPRLPLIFRSQFGEDLFLYELFSGGAIPVTSGFYIECGGCDGMDKSVTWIFDALGWDGLLVEPLPHFAEAARRNRPRARIAQTAVAEKGASGEIEFVHVVGNEGAEGSSHLPGEGEGTVKRAPLDNARRVRVPLTSLDALLADHHAPIDLFVLDVEGAERRVLSGLDLSRRRPRVILIEDHSMGSDSALLNDLTTHGYRHVAWIAYNRVMIHESEEDLLRRAREITLTV
ncbi:MAG TPA: FkbM family methyltransferase [Phycisphaerales bacterium]|nr:FkbM family methyltransferase [Phycisphaerales bacterium]